MRRHLSLLLAQIGLLISIGSFLESGSVLAQSRDSKGFTIGRIVQIEPKEPKGLLKIKQAKGLDPIDASPNMLVRKGFLLILDPAANAAVICGDGSKHELAPGPHGCPCTAPCTPEVCGINYDGSTLASTRGTDTSKGLFPVVISPRKTLLLGTRPTIRWAPIAAASKNTVYTVTLYGKNMKIIWTREVRATTTLAYPDKEPSLTREQTYKVGVAAEGLSSKQDYSAGLDFTILSAYRARALADEVSKRRRLGLFEVETRFLISNLYAATELYSEAIEQLEDQYRAMKTPAVAELLGDLYTAIGLSREAEKRYLDAFGLTPTNDLEGRAWIQRNLAQVYKNLGIIDQAASRLEDAIKLYRRLENTSMLKTLLNERRRLSKPSRRPLIGRAR